MALRKDRNPLKKALKKDRNPSKKHREAFKKGLRSEIDDFFPGRSLLRDTSLAICCSAVWQKS